MIRRSPTALLAGAALFAAAPAAAQTAAANEVRGYWWYQAPPAAPDAVPPAEDDVVKPEIPPMTELAKWSPPRIAKLIVAQRDYAATVLTVDAVSDFWRLQDFARRKARAFAGVTQLALLTHPELNAKAANPLIGEARDALSLQKDQVRRQYLRAHAADFALVMFSRSTCPYCRVQWPILQRFQDEMGWQVTLMDIDQRPDLAQRYGVQETPTTMVIRRGSAQRMVISAGIDTYPNIAQLAYQAVKLLTGDIRPEQWLTGAGEENGFFDALANGPVSPSDPRVTGGDAASSSRPQR